MRQLAFVLLVLLPIPPLALVAQEAPISEIPYESILDFLKRPPHLYLGESRGRGGEFPFCN